MERVSLASNDQERSLGRFAGAEPAVCRQSAVVEIDGDLVGPTLGLVAHRGPPLITSFMPPQGLRWYFFFVHNAVAQKGVTTNQTRKEKEK